jgi:hypothetical protein
MRATSDEVVEKAVEEAEKFLKKVFFNQQVGSGV